MISLEALTMVALATMAVVVAFTKLSCTPEDPRISWMPDLPEEATREKAGSAH